MRRPFCRSVRPTPSSSPATGRSHRPDRDEIQRAQGSQVRQGRGDAGFAGATADAFALFERLEAKIEQNPGNLTRACVELAKDWRTEKFLRRLEAMMVVADAKSTLLLSGTGDVVEPDDALSASDRVAIMRSPRRAR